MLCGADALVLFWTKAVLAIRRMSMMPLSGSAKVALEGIRQGICCVSILGLLFCATGPHLFAASSDDPPPRPGARELVQEVARNEDNARRNPRNYYQYVQKEITPEGSKTTIQIETPQGEVGKVVSINNKPPSQSRCRADANSLKRLATDTQTQRNREQDQKEQSERVEKLMAAVPNAFIFKFHGKQQGSGWIEIEFYPNPRFQPNSREAYLLKGMRGTLWVDPASHRLTKIDGLLFKDVKFGWGFLATLQRGGHFVMEQSKVSGGDWRQTYLQVDLDGSKLVFRHLQVHFKDISQSFVRLSEPPTLAQAVNMLEQSATACSQGNNKGSTIQAQFP